MEKEKKSKKKKWRSRKERSARQVLWKENSTSATMAVSTSRARQLPRRVLCSLQCQEREREREETDYVLSFRFSVVNTLYELKCPCWKLPGAWRLFFFFGWPVNFHDLSRVEMENEKERKLARTRLSPDAQAALGISTDDVHGRRIFLLDNGVSGLECVTHFFFSSSWLLGEWNLLLSCLRPGLWIIVFSMIYERSFVNWIEI